MLYCLFLVLTLGNNWDYNKEGEDWDNICNKGINQSPINIFKKKKEENHKLNFYFTDATVEYFNNGIYLEYEPIYKNSLGYFTYDNLQYYVQQFHFHSISEHTINNKYYPLELHIVGKTNTNKLGVVSILLDLGKKNNLLNDIGWSIKISSLQMPLCKDIKIIRPCTIKDDHNKYYITNKLSIYIKFSKLIELLHNKLFYHYKGSLTTPPCTENVDWFILNNILYLDKIQLSYYTKLLNNNPLLKTNHYHNNRHIKPINNRNIDII